jgi:hypothetical protein
MTTDAYLGAREMGDDFRETRAIRLAVALEALREALSVHSKGRSGYVANLTTKAVEPFVEAVGAAARTALATAGIASNVLSEKEVRSRSFSFFRRPFRQQIALLVSELGMTPLPDEEIGAFIRSRDSLVHRGSFLCDDEDAARLPPDEQAARASKEFWADFHVLDRIFVGLLGYRGDFVDARDTSGNTVTRVEYTDPAQPQRVASS